MTNPVTFNNAFQPTILAADMPLVVPMQLKLSQFRLRGIAVLIISRSKGVTLSFKTDPLESVVVSSTFDSVASVRRHLQSEIENRLRDLFCEEIPAILHAVSNEWLRMSGFSNETSFPPVPSRSSAFIERPYLSRKTYSPFSLNDLDEYLHRSEAGSTSLYTQSAVMAQSAPAELHNMELDQALLDSVENLEVDASDDGSHMQDLKQHYFQRRNIIYRAPSASALPDPVLLDGSKMFRQQPSAMRKWLRSLFSIPEGERETGREECAEDGLKAISQMESSDCGQVLKASWPDTQRPLLPKSFSMRSLRHSASVQYFDPEAVQFEPDEFRSDYFTRSNRAAPRQRVATVSLAFPVATRKGASQSLGTKLSIRHRLQSTLALSTYADKNILYRTMSGKGEGRRDSGVGNK